MKRSASWKSKKKKEYKQLTRLKYTHMWMYARSHHTPRSEQWSDASDGMHFALITCLMNHLWNINSPHAACICSIWMWICKSDMMNRADARLSFKRELKMNEKMRRRKKNTTKQQNSIASVSKTNKFGLLCYTRSHNLSFCRLTALRRLDFKCLAIRQTKTIHTECTPGARNENTNSNSSSIHKAISEKKSKHNSSGGELK